MKSGLEYIKTQKGTVHVRREVDGRTLCGLYVVAREVGTGCGPASCSRCLDKLSRRSK